MQMEKFLNFSIVIPVYNEHENLPLLHQSIHQALQDLQGWSWEVVLVDDGSTDGSVTVLEKLAEDDPGHTRVVLLRRNFGQTAAIAAGIDHSQGEVIVLMDADLQNDPADIPMMLEKIEEGYDVVSGWRINRQDTLSYPRAALADRQLVDLDRHRGTPARLWLHAQSLPPGSDHRFPAVRGNAPLHPCLCQFRRREHDRSAGPAPPAAFWQRPNMADTHA